MSVFDRLTASYAALVLRLGVGIVFLIHGWSKLQMGVGGVTRFFGTLGIPFPSVGAVIVIAVETIGALMIILGIFTRYVALAMAIEMLVAILVSSVPSGRGFELEGLLLTGALALVVLGDGVLAVRVPAKE